MRGLPDSQCLLFTFHRQGKGTQGREVIENLVHEESVHSIVANGLVEKGHIIALQNGAIFKISLMV